MSMFTFRGAQLDLARQMESLDFIREFIDCLAAHHYNYLLLYLEDRIRTASYPYPAEHESYTPEQMRDIVAYAQSRGIEVIPCVSIYGHVERFLRHAPMQALAELHDGRNGRFWNNAKNEFCPSNPQVYAFLQAYLDEIVPIFPCNYFHVGMDEVHNIGYCDRCREYGKSTAGEAELFKTILLRGYEMLKRHGRRLMMWDDMFDHYGSVLADLPRDILMVVWQYQDDVRFSRGHFGELAGGDCRRRYEELGFEYIIGPADWTLANNRSFTDYVSGSRCLGGLVTSWEKSHSFLYQSLPVFAYAGELWSGRDEASAWQAAVEGCFGCGDPDFCRLLRCIYENKTSRQSQSLNRDVLLKRAYFGYNYGRDALGELLTADLARWADRIKAGTGRRIFADLSFSVTVAALNNQVKYLFVQAADYGWTLEREKELAELQQKLAEAGVLRRRHWEEFRSGVIPCQVDRYFGRLPELLQETAALLRQEGMRLVLRFSLPCQYGAAKCRVSLLQEGVWQTAAEGVFKAEEINSTAYFEQMFFVSGGVPERLRLEVWGYGVLGVCFAQIRSGEQTWVPGGVVRHAGPVSEVAALLSDNLCTAWLGYADTDATFHQRERADTVASVELSLVRR